MQNRSVYKDSKHDSTLSNTGQTIRKLFLKNPNFSKQKQSSDLSNKSNQLTVYQLSFFQKKPFIKTLIFLTRNKAVIYQTRVTNQPSTNYNSSKQNCLKKTLTFLTKNKAVVYQVRVTDQPSTNYHSSLF